MQLRQIDANLILALHALLCEGNVTRAARSIGLGQSSMSHALARLRAHFGDRLLVQVGRNMALTDRARALMEPVDQAVLQLERVFARTEKFDPMTSQRIFRVAATDNVEFYLLPQLVASLEKEAPHVELRLHHPTADWIAALQSGHLDLQLGSISNLATGLSREDLTEERFTCVVRKDHPTAPRDVSLGQYAELRHLVVSPTPAHGTAVESHIDEILAQHDAQRRIALTVPHFLVAPYVIASSDLAWTAPERLVAPFISSLSLRVVDLPIQLGTSRIAQVWAERSHADEGHKWLRSVIARSACAGSSSTRLSPPVELSPSFSEIAGDPVTRQASAEKFSPPADRRRRRRPSGRETKK